MNTIPYRYDAILVLGASLHKKHFSRRVEKAVHLYNKRYAPLVIFSGRCWGGLKPRPRQVEADLMAAYAHQLGVPKKAILKERKSLNTVGNFYFTRQLFLEPLGLRRILVITHVQHFAKAKYLSGKVLGHNYSVTFSQDGPRTTHNASHDRDSARHLNLRQLRTFFDRVRDGNTDQLRKVIFSYHHYKGYKTI